MVSNETQKENINSNPNTRTSALGKIAATFNIIFTFIAIFIYAEIIEEGEIANSISNDFWYAFAASYVTLVLVFTIPSMIVSYCFIYGDGTEYKAAAGTLAFLTGHFIVAIFIWISKPVDISLNQQTTIIDLGEEQVQFDSKSEQIAYLDEIKKNAIALEIRNQSEKQIEELKNKLQKLEIIKNKTLASQNFSTEDLVKINKKEKSLLDEISKLENKIKMFSK